MGNQPGSYRRASERHNAPRLSNGGGGQALDQALRETERNRRAEAALREALRETDRRRAFPGKSPVPKSDVARLAKRAAGTALRRHPATSLVKAAWAALNNESMLNASSYNMATATLGGSSGVCPVVEPMDYSDIRPGLPSTVCNLHQAVGPNYSFHCSLGVGMWAKTAVGFNYNQLWWSLPRPGQTQAECGLREEKAGLDGSKYPAKGWEGMALVTKKLDPQSVDSIDAPQVGQRNEGREDPRMDPLAQGVRMDQLPAVALPVALVTNREGRGPGVGGEQSSWSNGDAVTKGEVVRLPPAPVEPAPRHTRERKATAPAWLLRAVGTITEEMDAVAAIYPCIPKALRKKVEFKGRKRPVSLEEKAQMVYKYWDQIHLGCAAFNLLWERIEDTTYARISEASKNRYAMQGRRTVNGGRPFEFSRQGDADLPNGQLPLSDLKKWLQQQLGLEGK